MDTAPQYIEEVKPIKRIGTVSWYEGEAARKLDRLMRRMHVITDVKTMPHHERAKIFRRLGIVPVRTAPFENMTPTVGFQAITKAMSGGAATLADITVNVHALGSGTTPPVDGDTQLAAEVTRTLLSSLSYSGSHAYYTAFYGLTQAVGTHHEMGLFINGAAGTPNSGVMWDRTLLDITKTNVQSLTIDYDDAFMNF